MLTLPVYPICGPAPGVVDAGGFGLVVLIEGAADGRGERTTPIATRLERTMSVAGVAYEKEGLEE